MNISRAREWIKYDPKILLRDGLQETWEWFQVNDREYLKKKNYFE